MSLYSDFDELVEKLDISKASGADKAGIDYNAFRTRTLDHNDRKRLEFWVKQQARRIG